MSLIVYADFNNPECYLASRRVDALRAAGVPVEWRAVEAEPSLSRLATPISPDAQANVTAGFERLQELLLPNETLPWSMPRVCPRTTAAVSAYAEAIGAGVADDVRRVLFHLYWIDGIDIGLPAALYGPLVGPMLRGVSDVDPVRDHGCAVSVTGDPVSTAAYRRSRTWRTDWRDLGRPKPPLLLIDDNQLYGSDAVEQLGKIIIEYGAKPDPVLDDPRRYPELEVRPSQGWLSETGGQWHNALHLTDARATTSQLTR